MKRIVIVLTLLLTAIALEAQTKDAGNGWNWFEDWRSSFNTDGAVNKLDSTAGYDFNKNVGVDFGLPFYFVHAANTTTTGTASGAGVGDLHLALLLRAPGEKWNYVSRFTGTAPTGSRSNGLTSGRATIDWNNHLDVAISRLTPFADLGLANTVPDSPLFLRPFTSLGAVGHFEGGALFDLAPRVSVGGSGYAIEPFGTQKVFSRLLKHNAACSGASKHGRVFQDCGAISGNGLTRDRGFDSWIDFKPSHYVTLEAGYSRSNSFDLNTFSFGIGFNAGKYFARDRQ